jgi:DNA polymerase III sliding clamp (beta) subunit (PCNA family)
MQTQNFSFSLIADTIKALLIFAAKQDVRYFLKGALVSIDGTEHGAHLAATDGHRLLRVPLKADKNELSGIGEAIIPRDILELAVKTFKSKAQNVTVKIHGYEVTLEQSGQSISGKTIDGKFPDITRVMPQKELSDPLARCNIQPDYIVDALKVINLLCAAQYSYAPLQQKPSVSEDIINSSPAYFYSPECKIVVMPIRT